MKPYQRLPLKPPFFGPIRTLALLISLLVGGLTFTCSLMPDNELQLSEEDSIVIIGNTFAERMHLFGYFETLLHAKYPEHQLRVRNMGWSADELTLRPRPKGFGDLHKIPGRARS